MPAANLTSELSTDSPSLATARRAGTTEKTRTKARFTAGAPDL